MNDDFRLLIFDLEESATVKSLTHSHSTKAMSAPNTKPSFFNNSALRSLRDLCASVVKNSPLSSSIKNQKSNPLNLPPIPPSLPLPLPLPISLSPLLPLLFLTLFLTSCADKPAEIPASKPKEEQARLVGRIASIHKNPDFTLIQSYGTWNIQTGAILATIGPNGRAANLKVTGEKTGQFAAADIQSGTLEIGDSVYTTLSSETIEEVKEDEIQDPKKLETL